MKIIIALPITAAVEPLLTFYILAHLNLAKYNTALSLTTKSLYGHCGKYMKRRCSRDYEDKGENNFYTLSLCTYNSVLHSSSLKQSI